jgi:hypothetical protein
MLAIWARPDRSLCDIALQRSIYWGRGLRGQPGSRKADYPLIPRRLAGWWRGVRAQARPCVEIRTRHAVVIRSLGE